MADIKDFILPDFLKDQSETEIHKEMLEMLKSYVPDMDLTEGGIAWDFTRPTAKEKAMMVNFILVEAIKNTFPMWAYGQSLDYLGLSRGIYRKPAVAAHGTLTVVGKKDTEIPMAFVFTTEAELDHSSILFKTLRDHVIPETGTIDIEVVAVNPGTSGNVASNKIVMLSKPIQGVESVTNKDPTLGGSDVEEDEALRTRIVDYDQLQGISYVGSMSDYYRWAMEVVGVGSAKVIPANDDTGLVKIVITDTEGKPANTELCTAVYNHIMAPKDPLTRLAPINAYLSVVPPEKIVIGIAASIRPEMNATMDEIREDFVKALLEYYPAAMTEGVVRYAEVGSLLIGLESVKDYENLKINNGVENIPIPNEKTAATTVNDLQFIEVSV